MRVAVIGLGSMGRRHALNILALGHEVVGVDPAGTDLGIPCHRTIAGLDSVDAAVIATHANRHLSDAIPLISLPLLIEKPLGLTTDVWPEAERLWVGYNWRFDDDLAQLREWAEAHPRNWAHFHFGQHLAEWRPGVPVASSPYLHSGLFLEASHEIDLAIWMVRPWSIHTAAIPGTDSFDATIISGQSDHGIYSIHLDWMTPGYRRDATIGCGDGVRSWTAPASAEETYRAEDRAFMESAAGRIDPRLATETDGLRVLKFIGAALGGLTTFSNALVTNATERPGLRIN